MPERHYTEKTSLEQLLRWSVVISMIVIFGIFYVWLQIQARNLNQDIMTLETREQWLEQENARLRDLVTHRTSQDAVQPVAANLMLLRYPVSGQVVKILPETAEEPETPIAGLSAPSVTTGQERRQ